MITNITELNTTMGPYPPICHQYFTEYIKGISVKTTVEYMIFPAIIIGIYFLIILAIQFKKNITDKNALIIIEYLESHMTIIHLYILFCLVAFIILNKVGHTII